MLQKLLKLQTQIAKKKNNYKKYSKYGKPWVCRISFYSIFILMFHKLIKDNQTLKKEFFN
jgi:hypothetical protein